MGANRSSQQNKSEHWGLRPAGGCLPPEKVSCILTLPPNRTAKFGILGQSLNAMIDEVYQAAHYLNGTGGRTRTGTAYTA